MAYNISNAAAKVVNLAGGTVAAAIDIEGGYFPVTSLNDIPDHAKVLGALCYVTGTAEKPINKFYQYNGTNWVEKEFGTTTEASQSAAGLMSADDKKKLDGIASGAEVNVQADWNETNTSSDAYIKNKPSNVVTTDTAQTITGKKTFSTPIQLESSAGSNYTSILGYDSFAINKKGENSAYTDTVYGDKSIGLYSFDVDNGPIFQNLLFPTTGGTIATREWVQANAIGSSTIDQEFFNSLYK